MKCLYNKKILSIASLCILIGVPLLKNVSKYLEHYNIISNYDYINPAIILFVSIPFLLYIYFKDVKNGCRKIDIYDYIFFLLVITGLISVAFSINKEISIFGKDYRHEGFLSMLCYYLLFINWKFYATKKDINNFIRLIIIISIVNSIYSLLQMYTNFDFIIRYDDTFMASGLCVNPNFFGSLIVTTLGIISCKFLYNKQSTKGEYFSIIILFISLINSQSTGPFIAYILVIIFLAFFLNIKKSLMLNKLLSLIIIFIITCISVFFINMAVIFVKDNGIGNFRWEIGKKGINETIKSGGNGRLKIWMNSLDIIKDNLLVGVGFDNFYLAYPNQKINSNVKLYLSTSGLNNSSINNYYNIVDNAHNVYIHTCVSTGIFGLIPYLVLCFLTFIRGLKSNNKLMFLLLSAFFAYSIQAFVNISVIQVAPIYFIIIGLMLSKFE